MHRISYLTALFGFVVALSAPATGQTSIISKDKPHTSIKLLADVQSIKPGSGFTLGLLMAMDKGWHTYWKNPGEAGLPTRLKWTLPEGVTAGEIIWPVPHKYIEGGEVLAYGYEHENMLLIPVSVSESISESQSATIKVQANWLECEHTCIPGSGSAELVLPVINKDPVPANEQLFSSYKKRIPSQSAEGSGVVISSKLQPGFAEIEMMSGPDRKLAHVEGTLPDFYSESIEGLVIGRTTVAMRDDKFAIRVPLSVFEPLSVGKELKGILVYQLEGEEKRAVEYSLTLPAGYVAKLSSGDGSSSGSSILDRTFETVSAPGSDQPLWSYILSAIIGGLLLNIMPCVLPVIALKVFGLVKMGGDAPSRVRRLGWFFSFGVLVSFLTLASVVIILQAVGQQVGWGFQFQEPGFVIAMCAVVFVFGLSLFGVFEIQLPSAAVEGVGKVVASQESGGYGASFWEGVFATILATPCTAPFLGTALGFAFAQPWWVILLIFSCVAFGMSLPYLILTTKPAWTKFLPKPGEWMVTAKQFMGFLMMATLLWLLYVLGKQLGMEGVIWTCAFLLTAGVAFWLIGKFATLTATRMKFALTWSVAGVLIIAGYLLFLSPVFEAQSAVAGMGENSLSRDVNGIVWEPFSVEKLDAALKENKPVFIDFTAEWCLTCKVNEKTVLASHDVVEKFKTSSILALKADWTNRNPEITALLSKFGRSGVPLYVVFPAGKPNAPIVLPEVITGAIVIEAIDKATSSVASKK